MFWDHTHPDTEGMQNHYTLPTLQATSNIKMLSPQAKCVKFCLKAQPTKFKRPITRISFSLIKEEGWSGIQVRLKGNSLTSCLDIKKLKRILMVNFFSYTI
jgi:hypothetical protein